MPGTDHDPFVDVLVPLSIRVNEEKPHHQCSLRCHWMRSSDASGHTCRLFGRDLKDERKKWYLPGIHGEVDPQILRCMECKLAQDNHIQYYKQEKEEDNG